MSEPPGITPADVDRLAEASEKLAMAAYAEAQSRVEYQERARLARRRFRITLALILLGFAVLYWRQENTNQAAKNARKTLIDCVTPTGDCYKDGQKRTAELVGSLNKVTTLAAACAPDYVSLPLAQRIVAIEHCIQRGLK